MAKSSERHRHGEEGIRIQLAPTASQRIREIRHRSDPAPEHKGNLARQPLEIGSDVEIAERVKDELATRFGRNLQAVGDVNGHHWYKR